LPGFIIGNQMRANRTLRAFASILAALGALTAAAQHPEVPAIVALTLDTSGSIKPEVLAKVKDLAVGVLQNLPPGSEVALFTFDDQSRLILDHTADAEAVRAALEGVQRAGRYTALYDALYDASRFLKQAPPARKAIILVTDGKDENSALKIDDGLKVAVDNKIPVFAVGIGQIEEGVLRRIAKLTSGEFSTMADAAPEALAARVRDLPIVAPEPPAGAAPAVAAAPVAAPEPVGGVPTWAYVVAGVVLVWALALLRAGRRATPPPAPPAITEKPAEEAQEGKGEKAPAESADSTVVMRNPTVGFVEKTVMIKFEPALLVTKGERVGQVFPLSKESAVSIGRAPTNDVAIKDVAMSGEHCRVRPEGGVWVVHDLESTNGTFVNEKRVTRHALVEGDVIRVGETLLKYSSRGGI
jgi:pSer/pThr/pTyr-binding forkhead associated (FHA) protein